MGDQKPQDQNTPEKVEKQGEECDHDWEKEYLGGMQTGDMVCRKCEATKY